MSVRIRERRINMDIEEKQEKIRKLQNIVDRYERIVFFGGAGVSTESGLADFRSVDGLYHQSYEYPPETILSHSFFIRHPEEFYRFYREKMLILDVRPNAAHDKLAQLETAGKLQAVITQNIDGLHQAAGSRKVLELHGSIHRNYCVKCGKTFGAEWVAQTEGVPYCPVCGSIVRPDVVLYEEALDESVIRQSVRAIREAEVLVVGGTSLTVYPAAGFLNDFQGEKLIVLNKGATPADTDADLVIQEPIGKILSEIRVREL